MEDNYKNNMVFGVHPVQELIRAQKEIEKVFIQNGVRAPEISEISNYCRANGIPVQYVPMEKMNRLTRKNHQGVIAFICPIEYQPIEKVIQMIFEEGRDPFILMLDRVTDVRNFGAIAHGTSGTGGTVIGTYKTSANGSFTVTGLKAGTYIAEELASDNDHVIDTAPQTAYLSGKAQDVVQLYFGNSPKGALMVKKIDSVTGKPLSGVEFFVTTSSGTVVGDANGKFYTDSAGSFTVSGIDPNTTLVVKETHAKDGYVLDDTPQTAKIKAGQTVTLEFRNAPKGNLIIRKIDSVTKQPLSGAEFKVIKSDGSFIPTEGGQISSNGIYTTDENGEIHITLLDPSTIVVTETKAPDGYLLDTTPQTVVVNSNDTQR